MYDQRFSFSLFLQLTSTDDYSAPYGKRETMKKRWKKENNVRKESQQKKINRAETYVTF